MKWSVVREAVAILIAPFTLHTSISSTSYRAFKFDGRKKNFFHPLKLHRRQRGEKSARVKKKKEEDTAHEILINFSTIFANFFSFITFFSSNF